ncbi:MAG: sodium-dependent transporter [Wenzhouxiangellaceae bacterium]
MVGVSIGLGNVWRFPYMMGQHGGSAFLLVYLLCVFLLAVPALIAEWNLGRHTRSGPLGAFTQVLGQPWGRLIGRLLVVTVLVADAYYLVVIGQLLITAAHSVHSGFSATNWPDYQQSLSNPYYQFGVSLALLLLSLWLIQRGLNRGIEQASRLFVPAFALILIYLVIAALSLPGAIPHLRAFLAPDFAALRPLDWFAALGQAFFSLGLGGTFFVVYGSYLPADQRLFGAAAGTALGDTAAALLAGLFIVPATLVFSLEMGQGPGLIFDTLPRLIQHMPAGQWLGALFLGGLSLVAILSNIAALEVARSAFSDQPRPWPPSRILLGIGVFEALLILPICLDNRLIGWLDLVFGSGMQVAGSLCAVLAVGWGLRRMLEHDVHLFPHPRQRRIYLWWLRWMIPLALFSLLLGYLLSLF